jgi:hypothetical protein
MYQRLSIFTQFQDDADALGGVMMVLILFMFVATIALALLEVYAVRQYLYEASYAKGAIENDARYSPDLMDHIIAIEELAIGKVLDQVAQAIVYQAVYKGMQVAVKVVIADGSSKLSSTQEQLHEAEAEAQKLITLQHSNIVQFLGLCIHVTRNDFEIKVLLGGIVGGGDC